MPIDDIPENVDLQWIARNLLALRDEVRSLRDDFSVSVAILHRVDNNQASYREELRALFDLHRELRRRIDDLPTYRK